MAIDTPPSLRSSSIYQVFVRNWSPEGTFDAALPALDAAVRLGFDLVYLTPIHPVGKAARKGSLGSPYAIADYRAVDQGLGGEAGFRRFLDAAHARGLRVLIDVVFNHTSPDSVLARAHPEWFHRGPEGRPVPRVAEWSDVVDLDHACAGPGLRDDLIETLELWVRFGVDGFRCDVASLVPVDFWIEARRRCATLRPDGLPPLVWLAESVHQGFVDFLRGRGIPAWSDGELHEAFDLSYDYDGRGYLEEAWAGRGALSAYLAHLAVQRAMLPAHAIKARFLENHDQERAAARFGKGALLRSWTVFAMLLEGCFFAYAGQEAALAERPSLFDAAPLPWELGDRSFEPWFGVAQRATRAIRGREDRFAVRELGRGIILVERSGGPRPVAALLNLEGRSGETTLPRPIAGTELLGGRRLSLGLKAPIPLEPLLIEEG